MVPPTGGEPQNQPCLIFQLLQNVMFGVEFIEGEDQKIIEIL